MARRSSQKSRRDPNAPKQKMGAWHTFFSDHREEVTVRKKNNFLNYILIHFYIRNKILT